MRIERLKIRNYKSFNETPEIIFGSGFNVIAGPNSSGKTALLEVLNLTFGSNAHRSLKTLPTRDTLPDPQSVAEVSVTLERDELMAMLAGREQDLWIALPSYPSDFTGRIGYIDNNQPSVNKLVEHVFAQSQYTFNGSYTPGHQSGNWQLPSIPSYGMYHPIGTPGNNVAFAGFRVDRERRPIPMPGQRVNANHHTEFGALVMALISSRIFRFSAERLNVGECPIGVSTELESNANNLAEVLANLQQNPVLFAQYNRLVHQILPQVQQVTIRPIANQRVQIIVWPHDPRSMREDLAIPISQCGTGIGQVLAIVYVAVHSRFPRVILIDEPQSFLHPGAVRKLVEVLSDHTQHQFIISTHSPTVITAADPDNILVTRLDAGVSRVAQVSARDNRALQSFLAEIGMHFSDVFGADNVLWVEGGTEEICFPLLLREIANKPVAGTTIVGVRSTGDLETKDAARIFEIYESLSTSGTLVPPAIGFILDRECRTPAELEDIRKRSKGLVRFLPRRMYENYLLNSAAISEAIVQADSHCGEKATIEGVTSAIETKRAERKYFCSAHSSEMSAENWLKYINGAKVLIDIFRDVSENRVEYDKVVHGAQLTRWLVQHSPDDLREVAELVADVVQPKKMN